MRGTVSERFWARVTVTPACWLWSNPIPDGYGKLLVNGHQYRAHRVAYELLVGPIPSGMILDHRCRNRACVNPDHLRPMTVADNNKHTSGRRAHLPRGAYRTKSGRWGAVVCLNGKQHWAGTHDTPEQAGEAARIKRAELFGEHLEPVDTTVGKPKNPRKDLP